MTMPPKDLVHNGRAVFGTFEGPVSRLDIRGLRAPYGGIPLPAFISNFRIKSSLNFCFHVGSYVGSVSFFDAKIFGLADLSIWNTETNRKYTYKSIMGPRRRFIPHNLEQGFCASFNKRRYIRVSWDHKRDRISIIFNIKGDSVRPSLQTALTGHFSDSATSEITQCIPIKSRRRCAASYFATSRLRGTLSIGKTRNFPGATVNAEDANAFITINRAYYSYVNQTQMIMATGIADNKNLSVILDNTPDMIPDPEVINRNLLIVDGKCTPLPPVKMTQPFGLEEKWIIQDTDNMVDLTFEPETSIYRDTSAFFFKIRMNTLYGKLEGVLKTKDGDDIKIDTFASIARDQMIRV